MEMVRTRIPVAVNLPVTEALQMALGIVVLNCFNGDPNLAIVV